MRMHCSPLLGRDRGTGEKNPSLSRPANYIILTLALTKPQMLTQWKGLTTGALAASGDPAEWGQASPYGQVLGQAARSQAAAGLARSPRKRREDGEWRGRRPGPRSVTLMS